MTDTAYLPLCKFARRNQAVPSAECNNQGCEHPFTGRSRKTVLHTFARGHAECPRRWRSPSF